MNSTHKHSQAVYEIIVQGELDQSWENFLESLAVTPGRAAERSLSTTTLVGPVIDQAALRGLLCKLWDLNLTLISVRRLEVDCSEEERND
jgi:hypothetical protein